jgi:GLPGLI family protein
MKQVLSAILLLLACVGGRSQMQQGRVVYEQKVDVWRRITDENMRSMMPQFNTTRFELVFTSETSLFRHLPDDDDIRDKAGEDGERRVVRMNMGGNDVTYHNYTMLQSIEQRELGPHKYLITDSLPHQDWKLDGETRMINGYTCHKALTRDGRGSAVVAWYTEDLPASAGPGPFGGLPGLILELNINDGEILYSAREIGTGTEVKELVKAPTEGKHISRKDFQKMLEEQMGPSNGGPVIRIIRN